MSNYLPLAIRKILENTGWTLNEIAVYSALLQKGGMDLTTVSYETGIAISTLQGVIKSLLLKKMINKTMINDKPVYTISNIDALQKWTKGFAKQFEHYENQMQNFIHQYDFNPQIFASKVRFYEGHKGVQQSYRQMVKDCSEKKITEMVGFFSVIEEVGVELQQFFLNEYVPSRVKNGIHIRNIAMESPKSNTYQKNDARDLRQTKLISKEYFPALNTEINLYDDYIHCMSFDEKSAFALILKDKQLVSILKAMFELLWKKDENFYMVDDTSSLQETFESRKSLYPTNLKQKWKIAKPLMVRTEEGETLLKILDHEVMSTYQLPYMKKLAEIATRKGGNILSVGYGLGLLDTEIENLRKNRKIESHTVIELNHHIAEQARKKENIQVLEGDWYNIIEDFRGTQFDGIVYDGYPLTLQEVHRDGIIFIERIVSRNLLKEKGILTFYVDAPNQFGKQFTAYLKNLGFQVIDFEKIPIKAPKRNRQIWKYDHFLAPVLQYSP